MSCYTPFPVVRENWGRADTAISDLGSDRIYQCVAIAPDSEADSVELRPGGEMAYGQRIRVSRGSPYIGEVNGNGLGIFPTRGHNLAGASGDFRHRLKMLFYRVPPPIAPGIGEAEFTFNATVDGSIVMPLIPAFGRKHVKFDLQSVVDNTAVVDISIEGMHAGRPYDVAAPIATPPARYTAPAGSTSWIERGQSHQWISLLAEVGLTAGTHPYSYKCTDAFDWYRIKATLTSGAYIEGEFNVKVALRE